MSQFELAVERVFSRRPEIEKCYRLGLVNRRALARFLVGEGVGGPDQLDALVATLRRHDFGPDDAVARDLFADIRVALKDKILILEFEKEKALLRSLERLIGHIDYDRGDTLKIVVGTSAVKLFIDRRKEGALRYLFDRFQLRQRLDEVSEISVAFPEAAIRTKGVLSTLTREFALNDIVVTELLTSSPELLVYLPDDGVPKAYEVLRALQQSPPPRRTRLAARSR